MDSQHKYNIYATFTRSNRKRSQRKLGNLEISSSGTLDEHVRMQLFQVIAELMKNEAVNLNGKSQADSAEVHALLGYLAVSGSGEESVTFG